ncbi:CPBP family intramembrane metalloprotease [Mycobacterium intermedium]|uniref:CPBP family intramembrane metalloprotease n=1 Tax=Mycobacterium intermedium TaxID=28445 RepID=A0A1E3SDI3_MYCIE|nr:type II CAAX endopeptidase family protein [Mycobacterium intermedium]MCV6965139.1 CPBP family intramembrane metalloprotease [Mycobacterium intermedium]ODR00132.1 abortive infection protein [Mycobacterium intermedium]OPE47836.1 CAAX protease family protein [Mycobacterium intermedium]ORA99483.1 CPBP family intramembrane metalloprotease [Mycobacterium intermedium]
MTQAAKPHRASVLEEVRRAITNVAVPHHEPPAVVLRRRIVVVITLVVGAVVLGFSLRVEAGDSSFYWLTLLLAAVWFVGGFLSGPLHLGGICWRGRNQRPVITGTTAGLLLGGVFVLGGLIAREIPVIAEYITHVLKYANQGSFALVVALTLINGLAEEVFFRGALYTALGRHYPVIISTVLYIAATLASGNPMLGFAAIILGTVCALERRATGGVLAPMLTHFMWGLIMVLVLPRLFGI